MKSFIRYLDKLVNALSIILLSSLVFVTFFQVINRFIFKYPFSWTEEMARFLLIWVTLIGAVLCTREDSHIQIDIFYINLNAKNKRILSIIINIIFLIFVLFIMWQGITILQFIKFQRAATLQMSMICVYIAGPLSALIMAIYLAQRTIKLFTSSVKTNDLFRNNPTSKKGV